MKITRRKLSLNSVTYSREFRVKRSAGIHLMQIVEYIGQTSGITKKHGDTPAVDLEHLALPGFLWEHVAQAFEKAEIAFSREATKVHLLRYPNLVSPGEMFWCSKCDQVFRMKSGRLHRKDTGHKGIFSTPDAFDSDDGAYVEWKFTWASSKRSHPKVLNSKDGIWKWVVQCMWNCYTLGTTTAKIIAFHCMGDWTYGMPKPQPYEITIEFTPKEISRNKKMIVNNARSKGWV